MMRGFTGVLAGLSQGYCQRFQIRNLKMMDSNWIPASQPAQVPRSILIPQWHVPLYPNSSECDWCQASTKKPKKDTMSRGNIWKGTWWKCTPKMLGPMSGQHLLTKDDLALAPSPKSETWPQALLKYMWLIAFATSRPLQLLLSFHLVVAGGFNQLFEEISYVRSIIREKGRWTRLCQIGGWKSNFIQKSPSFGGCATTTK